MELREQKGDSDTKTHWLVELCEIGEPVWKMWRHRKLEEPQTMIVGKHTKTIQKNLRKKWTNKKLPKIQKTYTISAFVNNNVYFWQNDSEKTNTKNWRKKKKKTDPKEQVI